MTEADVKVTSVAPRDALTRSADIWSDKFWVCYVALPFVPACLSALCVIVLTVS